MLGRTRVKAGQLTKSVLAEIWPVANKGRRGSDGAPVFTNMRHFLLTSCLLASTGLAQAAESSGSHFYVEPSALYATFPGGNIKDAYGASLAMGATFRGVHSVLLELGNFKADSDYRWSDLAFTPALLKYRYALPLASSWSAFVGVAGGVVFERERTVYVASPAFVTTTFIPSGTPLPPVTGALTTFTAQDRDTAAAFGAEIGVAHRLGDHASVGVSLTSLYLGDTSITTDGSMLLFNLRLGYRF